MARISIDGGKTFTTAEDAISHVFFEKIIAAADEDTMNKAHELVRGGSIFALLNKYLEIADRDLIIK